MVKYKEPGRYGFSSHLRIRRQCRLQEARQFTALWESGIYVFCHNISIYQIAQLQTARYPSCWWSHRVLLLEIFLFVFPAVNDLSRLEVHASHIIVACPIRNESHLFILPRVHYQKFNEYALPDDDIQWISYFPSKNFCASHSPSAGRSYSQIHIVLLQTKDCFLSFAL